MWPVIPTWAHRSEKSNTFFDAGQRQPVKVADGRIPAAQAIRQKYAPEVYGNGSMQGHKMLLSGIAPGAAPKN